MEIKYVISPYDYAGQLVVKIWEEQSDVAGAEVYTQVLDAPHTDPRVVTANGLDKVVHVVRLYEVETGNLLHEYDVEPKLVATIFDPIYFKIGDGGANTPASGSNTYQNDILQGLDETQYTVFRNNYGYLFFGQHILNNPGPGGFVLDAPDAFGDDDEFVIQMKQQMVNSTVNDSVVGKMVGGFVDVSADTVYSNDHLRKLIRFDGTCKYTFEAASGVPIGYSFRFNHFGETDGTGTVEFLNGQLRFGAELKSSIDINGRGEGCFVWDGLYWNVIYYNVTAVVVPVSEAVKGDTIGVGSVLVGDVPAGDVPITVNHALNVTGDYSVFISIMSNVAGDAYKNNLIGMIPWHYDPADKPNKFIMVPQEIKAEVQNVTIHWLIIKL